MNPGSARVGRPRLKERVREAAGDAILEAAEEVLLKQGLMAPMDVIAARAGVAVGTLYNHFADRSALIEALLNRHRAQLVANVRAAEEGAAHLPVQRQLHAMLTAMFGSWSKLMLVIRQNEHLPDAKKRAKLRERFVTMFGGVISRGQKEGVIARDPDGLHTVVLQGLIQSMFIVVIDEPKKLDPLTAVEKATAMFFKAVAP